MRFATYTKYRGGWLDAMNLESLMESLSDFFMNGGFAGGPNYHPYWGWSGTDDTTSMDSLKHALLKALLKSGQLTPEMLEELRGKELVIVPELNYMGQFASVLRTYGVNAEAITQYTGLPFKVADLIDRIREKAGLQLEASVTA